ncbi:MAG: leucyl/phenylalanyl-tRNA--protein transferase [Rhodospirillales bacterium]|nr:leucyl/phenylalanyl-tRNA--protein transferase [Rhodospirillales bacterium]
MNNRKTPLVLSPELLLRAYATGIFPMAENQDDPHVHWVEPEQRGILPLDKFHVPKSLKKVVRKATFEVHCDRDFVQVLDLCAARAEGREQTWINRKIRNAVIALHAMGYAHSVECWRDNRLVGGLYGIALGAAFFGESMFSLETNASKVALVHLVARLRLGGFQLLDTQFVTDHLSQFGTVEIPSAAYLELLDEALKYPGIFAGTYGPGRLNEMIEMLFNADPGAA